MSEPELVTFGEAMRRLGISKHTLARLVKERGMRVYQNPLDRREKLLDTAEVERVRRPQLVPGEPEGKAAA